MPSSIINEVTKLLCILSLNVKIGIIANGGIQICMKLLRNTNQIKIIVHVLKLLIRLISLDDATPLELRNQAILAVLTIIRRLLWCVDLRIWSGMPKRNTFPSWKSETGNYAIFHRPILEKQKSSIEPNVFEFNLLSNRIRRQTNQIFVFISRYWR